MSIVSEINRINTNIANAYSKCNEKGATMPQTQNSSNLASTINSISSGTPNLQSKSETITTNTTTTIQADSGYDGLSSVEVITNVSGGGGIDWSAIGYNSTPQAIVNGYNYAKQIYDNWDGTQTSLYNAYSNNYELIIFPLVDTSNITTLRGCFKNCPSLIVLPQLNTSKVEIFREAFGSCSALQELPLFDTSSATNLQNMVGSTLRLNDTSLDNILKMCINSKETNKTLTRLGFNSSYYSASRIQALPSYQDFIDAGWTIGY